MLEKAENENGNRFGEDLKTLGQKEGLFVEQIATKAFKDIRFRGEFPKSTNQLNYIGDYAFARSRFSGRYPANLKLTIDKYAFEDSFFHLDKHINDLEKHRKMEPLLVSEKNNLRWRIAKEALFHKTVMLGLSAQTNLKTKASKDLLGWKYNRTLFNGVRNLSTTTMTKEMRNYARTITRTERPMVKDQNSIDHINDVKRATHDLWDRKSKLHPMIATANKLVLNSIDRRYEKVVQYEKEIIALDTNSKLSTQAGLLARICADINLEINDTIKLKIQLVGKQANMTRDILKMAKLNRRLDKFEEEVTGLEAQQDIPKSTINDLLDRLNSRTTGVSDEEIDEIFGDWEREEIKERKDALVERINNLRTIENLISQKIEELEEFITNAERPLSERDQNIINGKIEEIEELLEDAATEARKADNGQNENTRDQLEHQKKRFEGILAIDEVLAKLDRYSTDEEVEAVKEEISEIREKYDLYLTDEDVQKTDDVLEAIEEERDDYKDQIDSIVKEIMDAKDEVELQKIIDELTKEEEANKRVQKAIRDKREEFEDEIEAEFEERVRAALNEIEGAKTKEVLDYIVNGLDSDVRDDVRVKDAIEAKYESFGESDLAARVRKAIKRVNLALTIEDLDKIVKEIEEEDAEVANDERFMEAVAAKYDEFQELEDRVDQAIEKIEKAESVAELEQIADGIDEDVFGSERFKDAYDDKLIELTALEALEEQVQLILKTIKESNTTKKLDENLEKFESKEEYAEAMEDERIQPAIEEKREELKEIAELNKLEIEEAIEALKEGYEEEEVQDIKNRITNDELDEDVRKELTKKLEDKIEALEEDEDEDEDETPTVPETPGGGGGTIIPPTPTPEEPGTPETPEIDKGVEDIIKDIENAKDLDDLEGIEKEIENIEKEVNKLPAGKEKDSLLKKVKELKDFLASKKELLEKTKTHNSYITGYEDGTVKPENNLTREEISTIIFRIAEMTGSTTSNYTDVKPGRWSAEAINALSNRGVIKGYADGRFKPTDNVTRAEAVVMLVRYSGVGNQGTIQGDFKGHWAEKEIATAISQGWINGYNDGTFRPNNNITRAEFVKIANLVFDRDCRVDANIEGLTIPRDLNTSKWYFNDMLEAITDHNFIEEGNNKVWTGLAS